MAGLFDIDIRCRRPGPYAQGGDNNRCCSLVRREKWQYRFGQSLFKHKLPGQSSRFSVLYGGMKVKSPVGRLPLYIKAPGCNIERNQAQTRILSGVDGKQQPVFVCMRKMKR